MPKFCVYVEGFHCNHGAATSPSPACQNCAIRKMAMETIKKDSK